MIFCNVSSTIWWRHEIAELSTQAQLNHFLPFRDFPKSTRWHEKMVEPSTQAQLNHFVMSAQKFGDIKKLLSWAPRLSLCSANIWWTNSQIWLHHFFLFFSKNHLIWGLPYQTLWCPTVTLMTKFSPLIILIDWPLCCMVAFLIVSKMESLCNSLCGQSFVATAPLSTYRDGQG